METEPALYPQDCATYYRRQGYWTSDTLASFLPDLVQRCGDDEAVVGRSFSGKPVRLSYRELYRESLNCAGRLHHLGIRQGDYVVVQLPNITEYVSTIFGIWLLGARPVFALPAHRHKELGAFIMQSQAKALITMGNYLGFDYRSLARDLTLKLDSVFSVIIAGNDPEEFHPLAGDNDAITPVSPDPESIAFLQVSGGTTGLPKLIPRSHADYLYSVRESARICGCTSATKMLILLPVSHNFAMSSPGLLGALWAGGTVFLSQDPSPSAGFKLIDTEAITTALMVPPLLNQWISFRPGVTSASLASLDSVLVGGAKLAPELARKVPEVLGCRLRQVFGMAEGLVSYTRDEDPEELVIHTQGRPISPDDEILIVDEEGNPVAEGTSGHLLTRGPYTIRSYFRGQSPEAFTPDGFYRTGDIVQQLPSGHLIVVGRAKEQINRAGEKISVAEIESHLRAHPDIHDAVVVGVPDELVGERICAVALSKTRPGAHSVRGFLRDRGVADYKLPDCIEYVSAFPTTGVGKISRKKIAEEFFPPQSISTNVSSKEK